MTTSNNHTVEKIGGTSMSDYPAVRDNIMLNKLLKNPYQRVFVVSAYGGLTNLLLEHKKTAEPGIYGRFALAEEDQSWIEAFGLVKDKMLSINSELFGDDSALKEKADKFILRRLTDAERVLSDLSSLCQHGHFEIADHLLKVREMLASIGEAHSAFNLTHLLQKEGINAVFVDLTGWDIDKAVDMDELIKEKFWSLDLSKCLPIATGYCHSEKGLMATFDRGYSEMTFSRIAVLTKAKEAVIHKEYHLSSADPKLVGLDKVVPIGLTNYDVADQLANLGMEAIHPRAAKGLRQSEIPLRVKNTFEPEHKGTLITSTYISDKPKVEIIAGREKVYAFELFDQDMMGQVDAFDRKTLDLIHELKMQMVSKDVTANSITHYLSCNLKKAKRLQTLLEKHFPEAEVNVRKVCIVSAIGSDMQEAGMLARAVAAIAEQGISIQALHQSMRQVDIQFVLDEKHFESAVVALHKHLVESENAFAGVTLDAPTAV
ncbi:aspartate kinase [Catenovulum sp. 2E275]|uniref:aspartate kinase n=1 Tax=Catenovulum sp. 2E275 TaxID=2980497 RepID=UPI0021D2140A|nr:aspartate kinase [Catenovulum sp. 2E275]MCU4674404.1 aspartate kinase [Catenovulum sp. 2E275]